jgi:MoxR-like ATPase
MDDIRRMIKEVLTTVQSAVINSQRVIARLLVAFILEDHVLLEDEPGTGKTHLAKTLAAASGLVFKRIQGNPDLRPSDILGLNVWNPKSSDFDFRPGPVFTNILLVDEVNRMSPRTQSALLEAMQERQVTIDGVTHPLPTPFIVIATQNPIEHEGVYPLPEAQLDRFIFQMKMDELSVEDEVKLLELTEISTPEVQPVNGFDWSLVRKGYEQIHVEPAFRHYVAELMAAAREQYGLGQGARAGQALIRSAKAQALIEGSAFITEEQIDMFLSDVLNHRVRGSYGTRSLGEEEVDELLSGVRAPSLSIDELQRRAHAARI